MKIVVGLGNPGGKYKGTRHNIGFMVLDAIASKSQKSKVKSQNYNLKFKTAELKWYFSKKFRVEYMQTKLKGKNVLLIKPQTFMNKSGEAVRKILDFYKIPKKEWGKSLFVIHDELDLPLGRFKIQQDVGPSGHHGVESIIAHMGTKNFVRFRVGVGKGDEDYLLSNFRKDEIKIIKPVVKKTAEAVIYAIESGVKEAMNRYN